jgi:hypothetical protein
MPNSIYFDGVVRCCYEVGITPPTTHAQFEDNTLLPSPTLKLKLFYDSCQRHLMLTLNGKPTERRFAFNTVAGIADYDLDPLTKVENILYHTVRNNTSGFAQRLWNKPYNEYRDMYADLATISQSAPQWWVAKPTPAEAGVTRTSSIILVPTPVQVFEIEYLAKIVAQPLVLATDIIMFEPEYEHILWTWAKAMMESKLGVDMTASQYAQSAVDQYRAWTKRPQEEKRGVRMGVSFNSSSGDSGRYDNSDYSRGW